MELYKIVYDANSDKSMKIAFGENVLLRKKWLAK